MADASQRPAGLPTQTGLPPQDRRQLRKEYRSIDDEARKNSEKLSSINSGELHSILRRTNELHKQVEKPREHAMDAGLFCVLTEAGCKATEKLVHNQQGRSVLDFIIALRHNYVHSSNPQDEGAHNQDAFDWGQLGKRVSHCCKPAPGVSCMLGPMDVQAKVRKVAQRQSKRPTGEVVRPEELEHIQEQEKQETDRNMEEMWGVLKALQNCPVAELVCNHKCFAQTVENLFTLSFLVRDQRAYLYHDADQGMMVQVVDARGGRPAPTQTGKRPDEQLQFVIGFTMDDWEMMTKVVKPRDTKMRHRDQTAVMALNAAVRQQQQRPEVQAGPSGHASQPPKRAKTSRPS